MLIAILMLYFASDLRELTDRQLIAASVVSSRIDPAEQAAQIADLRAKTSEVHTFNILALSTIGANHDGFRRQAARSISAMVGLPAVAIGPL